jgi:hypothetical protein
MTKPNQTIKMNQVNATLPSNATLAIASGWNFSGTPTTDLSSSARLYRADGSMEWVGSSNQNEHTGVSIEEDIDTSITIALAELGENVQSVAVRVSSFQGVRLFGGREAIVRGTVSIEGGEQREFETRYGGNGWSGAQIFELTRNGDGTWLLSQTVPSQS